MSDPVKFTSRDSINCKRRGSARFKGLAKDSLSKMVKMI